MLNQTQQDAVKVFEEHAAAFVTRAGGVPHCPRCGVEAHPHPLPWVVGPRWWACGEHGDFPEHESRIPPAGWRPTDKHPAYIHEAFERRSAT